MKKETKNLNTKKPMVYDALLGAVVEITQNPVDILSGARLPIEYYEIGTQHLIAEIMGEYIFMVGCIHPFAIGDFNCI